MTVSVTIPRLQSDQAWRKAARDLLMQGIPPEGVQWNDAEATPDLFAGSPSMHASQCQRPSPAPRVSRGFISLSETVVWHAEPQRFAMLYLLLWRLQDTPRLMQDRGDPLVSALRRMEKSVHRCQHKMRAFVRFREVGAKNSARRQFAAWFEPSHHTVEPNAGFFRKRFGDMDWQIITPDVSVTFVDGQLRFTLDEERPDLPEDGHDDLWRTYFRNIFNPARLKTQAMRSEMPQKYWKNLPEARDIPELIASARNRAQQMADTAASTPNPLTDRWKISVDGGAARPSDMGLDAEIRRCRQCALADAATQAVPGEGSSHAALMIVGEQPGDTEDLEGRPFVGPAGRLLEEALRDLGLAREDVFLTNAVKHFKYRVRGKRRIHQRPDVGDVARCRWWLSREINELRPRLIVALGATAARALTGKPISVHQTRGTVMSGSEGYPVLVTYHPAYILRLSEPGARAEAHTLLRDDLARACAEIAT